MGGAVEPGLPPSGNKRSTARDTFEKWIRCEERVTPSIWMKADGELASATTLLNLPAKFLELCCAIGVWTWLCVAEPKTASQLQGPGNVCCKSDPEASKRLCGIYIGLKEAAISRLWALCMCVYIYHIKVLRTFGILGPTSGFAPGLRTEIEPTSTW